MLPVRTGARVLEEIARLAFSDIGQVLDFSGTHPRLRPACDIPEDARRALTSVKVKRYAEGRGEGAGEVEVTEIKLWDKLAALEKAGRHLGLFAPDKHRHEHPGPGGGPNPHEHQHDHHIAPSALRDFAADVAAAGLGHLSDDGGGQPVGKEGADPTP
jgi:hypothetical protein